eukprot:1150769-Rhodomonas_salina.2
MQCVYVVCGLDSASWHNILTRPLALLTLPVTHALPVRVTRDGTRRKLCRSLQSWPQRIISSARSLELDRGPRSHDRMLRAT